jgi:hypothetical protein
LQEGSPKTVRKSGVWRFVWADLDSKRAALIGHK